MHGRGVLRALEAWKDKEIGTRVQGLGVGGDLKRVPDEALKFTDDVALSLNSPPGRAGDGCFGGGWGEDSHNFSRLVAPTSSA